MENNVVWHDGRISRQNRHRLNRHGSCLVWFTGLPASGKSTIAHALEEALFDRRIRSYVLDGDNIRHGINSDLGFKRADRKENLRRIAEISKLLVDAGVIVLASFVSPYRKDREFVRNILGNGSFLEIYVKCSPRVCEHRDPKGQYKKARAGTIKNYTGVSAPYEEPKNPDLVLASEKLSVEESVSRVLELLDREKLTSIV